VASFDAIVIGLGGMGSAALYHLARRGLRPLGIEQFGVAHDRGSSHGRTRLIRKAYFEHPDYVPLIARAYQRWADLERESGKKLLRRTGLVLFGPPSGPIIIGVQRAADEHALAIETLTPDAAQHRFPQFNLSHAAPVAPPLVGGAGGSTACGEARKPGAPPLAVGESTPSSDLEQWESEGGRVVEPPGCPTACGGGPTSASPSASAPGWPIASAVGDPWVCLFEPDAGCLAVEECVRAYLDRAVAHGGTVALHESVRSWTAASNGVNVVTDKAAYQADRLIITGGPWSARLLADLGLPLRLLRKVVLWFPTRGDAYREDHGCPVFGFDLDREFIYGFPVIDADGIKISDHRGGQIVSDPDAVDRRLHPADVEPLARFVSTFLPGVDRTPCKHSVCLYTMTPDEHFIIDRHPQHPHVVFAAGFSGHGFKFAPVIGSVLTDLALDGRTAEPVGFLRRDRPSLHT
jgi:glycine/D-amino acid oxidase-like deaminating enzyme